MTVFIFNDMEHYYFVNTKGYIHFSVDKSEVGSLMRAKKAYRKAYGLNRKPIIWKTDYLESDG